MSTQALAEGLIGVVLWRIANGLCGVVSRRVCTMGIANELSLTQGYHKRARVESLPAAQFLGRNVGGAHR